jgi:hypothetical protein
MTPRARKGWEFVTERGRPNSANLLFVAEGALRALARLTGSDYTPESLPAISQAYLNGKAPVHQVMLVGSDSPLISTLRALGTIHLRMFNRQGRTFVYGMRPITPGYVMTVREDRPYDLLRVV